MPFLLFISEMYHLEGLPSASSLFNTKQVEGGTSAPPIPGIIQWFAMACSEEKWANVSNMVMDFMTDGAQHKHTPGPGTTISSTLEIEINAIFIYCHGVLLT